ncbi:MAG: sugar transferase [Anditalea sp.]
MNNLFTSGEGFTVVNYGSIVAQRQSLNLTDPPQLILKRSLDVFFSLFTLIFICSWLFPFIALMIKLTSKEPVVLKQLRHGRNNVPFFCFKFRTMKANDEGRTKQAIKNDPRITKFGLFLRRTSLDELPQIFNVIMGEMSIVGPRPHAVSMNNKFSEGIDDFMLRHAVKPGITGLAQLKSFRGETKRFHDINSMCKLDLFYIKNWSLFLDIKIMIWSAASFMKIKNAY